MRPEDQQNRPTPTVQAMDDDDGDLTDMLGELRVLLPTAQLLSACLLYTSDAADE